MNTGLNKIRNWTAIGLIGERFTDSYNQVFL